MDVVGGDLSLIEVELDAIIFAYMCHEEVDVDQPLGYKGSIKGMVTIIF